MTGTNAPLKGIDMAVLLDQLSKQASHGAGQVYELYSSRFTDLVDDRAATLPPADAAKLIAYASAHHDYVPVSERTSFAEDGCCPCGLDERTCPNGHFEHDDFPGDAGEDDDFEPKEGNPAMPFDDASAAIAPPGQLYISRASVLLLQAERRLSIPGRWCQGKIETTLFRYWPQHCMLGALDWAAENFDMGDGGNDKNAARDALDRAVRARGFADPAAFNDHPATTRGMVRQMLTQAATLACVTAQDIVD